MLLKIINRGVEHVFKILSEIISEIKFEFFNMGVKGRNFFPRSDFCSLLVFTYLKTPKISSKNFNLGRKREKISNILAVRITDPFSIGSRQYK